MTLVGRVSVVACKHHTLARIWALCLLPAILHGCGTPPGSAFVPPTGVVQPLSTAAVYCPDEYLKWSLKWKGLAGASSEMATGKVGIIDGESSIIVYSLSRSSALAAIFVDAREELTSQISLESGRALSNSSVTVEDDETEALNVSFSKLALSYTAKPSGSKKTQVWTEVEQSAIADLHSALGQLRAWDGLPAAGAFLYVQSGRSHYRLEVVASASKPVRLGIGTFPAIRLQGLATRERQSGIDVPDPAVRKFTLWRSDDGRFLPLKFSIDTRLGSVQGTLVDQRQSQSNACVFVSAKPAGS